MQVFTFLAIFLLANSFPITAKGHVKPDSLFIRIEISQPQPFVNEHVALKYKLYFDDPERIKSFKPVGGMPNYYSSRGTNIPLGDERLIKQEYVNGHQYNTTDIFQAIIFPQEEGPMKLQPLTLDVTVAIPTERFDQNNQRIISEKVERISTGDQQIVVKSLPEKGKPKDFSGAVGQFAFDVRVLTSDKNPRVFSAIVEVSGKGNLGFFEIPSLTKALSSFAIGKSDYRKSIKTGIFGKEGSVIEWTPFAGKRNDTISIPSLSFSYFDPVTEIYEQMQSSEITVEVK